MIRISIFIVLLFSINLAEANDEIKHDLPLEHRIIYNLTLETSTLENLQSIFGKTASWPRPDEHHDPFLYCYQLKSIKPTWAVFGFGWAWGFKKFDSILITADSNQLKGACEKVDIKPDAITTKGGLGLNITQDSLAQIILDKPTVDSNTYLYRYSSYTKYDSPKTFPQRPFKYIGEYNYGEIKIKLNNKRVSGFYIWASGEPDW